MRKKILFVFSKIYYGGAERQFRELICNINKERFSVVVAVTGTDNDTELVNKFETENPDIKFYHLKNTYYISAPKNLISKVNLMIRYIFQMYRIIKKECPYAVLVYNGLELSGSRLFSRMGAKVIFSERESGNRGKRKLKRYKQHFKSVNKIVCNSREAQRFYEIHGIKSSYFPNGIRICDMLPISDKEQYRILVPARIARVKNQELVLKALSLCRNSDYKVTFIGKHEDADYLKELHQLTRELNLDNQVEFLSFTNDMKEMYRKAHLVVLSSYMEGFTNILLESYLYGRPCLVSDIVMNRDVANDSQDFFGVEDAVNLSELINRYMLRSDQEWQDILNENHNYVVNNFSVEVMVKRYEKLFDTL